MDLECPECGFKSDMDDWELIGGNRVECPECGATSGSDEEGE